MFARFKLVRATDVTGISGTGDIAAGIEWPNGTVSLYWLKTQTHGYYKSVEQVQHIHCYPDSSGVPNARIEWLDPVA